MEGYAIEKVLAPSYDISQSYEWNYQNAPEPLDGVVVPDCPGAWDFCGLPVNSPLGIPAGPLLNSRWIRYYAGLGFDVLTYKTVRSLPRESYDPPNLLPVATETLSEEGHTIEGAPPTAPFSSWAISFGMPSREPALWREDVERARLSLGKSQVLVVSVVASPQPGWSVQDVARDFALCARWAADSGAQAIEANLSCPNVCTAEADLYLSPSASAEIAATIRQAVPELPLILKIGLFAGAEQAEALIQAVSPYATALSSTNSITAKVRDPKTGELLFGGLRRGIGGAAITKRCTRELSMLRNIIARLESPLKLIGVGGICSAQDVAERLRAGAHHVQIATAAMIDPLIALRIRAQMSR